MSLRANRRPRTTSWEGITARHSRQLTPTTYTAISRWCGRAGSYSHDYFPFGEELSAGAGGRADTQGYGKVDNVRQQFTGKERDNETQLDYFGARYHSSAQGRFTSVDPGKFTPADPQSWNRYPYTQNNPLKFVDPTGKELYLNGEYAEELVKELERLSGYTLNYDKLNGHVTIDRDKKRQSKGTSKSLATAIDTAVTSKEDVAVTTVSESKDNVAVFGDQFKWGRVDIDDYRVMARDSEAVATGFLTHVLTEYTAAAEMPSNYSPRQKYALAHNLALVQESMAVGEMTNTITTLRADTSVSGGLNNPPMTIRVRFTSVQFDVIVKSGANGKATQFDKIITTVNIPNPGSK